MKYLYRFLFSLVLFPHFIFAQANCNLCKEEVERQGWMYRRYGRFCVFPCATPCDGDTCSKPSCCGYDCYGKPPRHCCGINGVWMPEAPPLFEPLIADPRQLNYSLSYRVGDQTFQNRTVIAVSFADSYPLYRWFDIGPCRGDLQIDLAGGVWAIFWPFENSAPLVNADYFAGIPITYSHGNWSYRLRIFHISRHLGDEFLLMYPNFNRKNPSAEYIDFIASYYVTDEIRIYGGLGRMLHQDESFMMHTLYSEFGLEYWLNSFARYSHHDSLLGQPFFAMHFRWNEGQKFVTDQTYALGYEIRKMCGLMRRMRVFIQYHNGTSRDGQFEGTATDYFSVRFTYGY